MSNPIKRARLSEIRKATMDLMAKEIEALPFKPKQREDLKAGMSDGWAACIRALTAEGLIKIED